MALTAARSLIYHDISRAKVEAVGKALVAAGYNVDPAKLAGSFSADAYTVSYSFDEAAGELTVKLVGPFIFMTMAVGKIDKAIHPFLV
jgi:hypothetical protein